MQMKLYIKKLFILFIPIVMLCNILSEYSFINAEAASNRSIKIEEVRGTVMIQKSGGVKLIRAYEGMMLQQGDRIMTNAYSSLKLVIPDTKDEITIDQNADFFITNLHEVMGSKRTKFTIWNGSIWAKVTPLVNSKDKFEIGTPSSTMKVKGTNFFVGVDPNTGLPTLAVLSGNVNVQNSQGGGQFNVYPASALTVGSGDLGVIPIDNQVLSQMLESTSPAVMEAILRSAQAIIDENQALMDKFTSVGQGFDWSASQGELNQYTQNVLALLESLAKEAFQQKKIDEQTLNELIKKLKEQQVLNLDLNNVVPLQFSDAEKEKQAQLQRLEEERKKKLEEEKRKQEQLKQQQQNLVNKLEEQRKKQIEQKEKALEEVRKKAEEALKRKLDEAAKLALEEKLKALELEKQKQEAAAADAKAKAEAPVPTPPSQPTGNPGPSISNVDKNLAQAKATIPAFSELYTEESWSRVLFALELGEANSGEKVEKTEAIKLAVAGLVTIIDQNLMDAKSSIPTNSTLYTPDTWGRVLAALSMAETNNNEKVEKTEAIRSAVEGLVEIPVTPEIVIEEPTIGTNYIRVHWNHYADATKYEVYLNGELVDEYDGIMDTYDFTYDMLQSGKSYTLEILALDESASVLANKTIDFQTEASIEDLVPTP